MAKRKTRSSSGSSSDPVTRFADAVSAGRIIAGPDVRAACERHLRDMTTAHKRGFRFDPAVATEALDFFPLVLRLAGGEYEGKAFSLLRWQEFVIGSLFGWLRIDDGTRRFRMAYIETGKGSGKSPLVAGIGLFGLIADNEPRAEIYAAATKKDQAMILFRDATAAVKQSPALQRRLHLSGAPGSEWNIAYRTRGSFFRPISADDGQSGPRVHMGLVDEIHEHKSDTVVEMLRAGTKKRRQALIVMITNSGADKTTVCWNYHTYGQAVAAGMREDDSFFAFICGLDKDDDPITDEACWAKANPSLVDADLPGYRYLREQVVTARGMPARESRVRRLNFCEWTEAINPWIGYQTWAAIQIEYAAEDLRGRNCIAALDLASTTDLVCLLLLFEPRSIDDRWRVLPFFWKPEDGLVDKENLDRVPYTAWKRDGFLETTPGKAISKLVILQRIAQLDSMFTIDSLVYDRWRIEDLKQLATDEGIDLPPMIEFGQGYKDMSPAVEETERMLLTKELAHNGHPVLTWNVACATLETDAAGNRKPSKRRSTGRIDGVVALVMAIGQKMKERQGRGSVYDDIAKSKRAA
jgi:phage terminase large subunit-like protein